MNYKRIHDQIIEKAKNSNRFKGDGNYYEAHHIIPQCMGGEGKTTQWRTHPNIVLLTAKEHFVVHKLLCEIYPDNNDLIYAYWLFVNGTNDKKYKGNKYYNIGSREYERIRINFAIIKSQSMNGEKNPNFGKTGENHHCFGRTGEKNPMFGRTGEKHPNFGKPRSDESKQKQREKMIGKLVGEKHPNFGKSFSDETRKKLRENHADFSGEKHPRAKKIICDITKKIYGCITEASIDLGLKRTTLNGYLTGSSPNKTSLRYL